MRPSLLLVLALALAACADDTPPPAAPTPAPAPAAADGRQSVYDVVAASPRLSTLAGLVDAAGLAEVLRDTAQTLTLFAPANEAFAGADLDALRADPGALRTLLLGHALGNRTLAADVFAEIGIETLGGSEIVLDTDRETVTVRGPGGTVARVIDADLDADNGVVHILDAVLGGPASR